MNKNADCLVKEAIDMIEQNSNMLIGTSASHMIIWATRSRGKNKTILYLCDGEVPTCRKDECYKRGGECCHTTDTTHALNQEPRNLVPDEQGKLWETAPESKKRHF